MRVPHDLFATLGVSPELGRTFSAEEDRPDRWYVVMLSYGYWKEAFGGRPGVLGETIVLDQIPFEIVGVLPETFAAVFNRYSRLPQVYAPLGYDASLPYACRSCQHLRMALGAKRGDVMRLIFGEGVRLAALGILIGVAASLLLGRFLSGLLYGTSDNDPGTLFGVAVLLCGVALLACYIPVRRATRVDPLAALRYE